MLGNEYRAATTTQVGPQTLKSIDKERTSPLDEVLNRLGMIEKRIDGLVSDLRSVGDRLDGPSATIAKESDADLRPSGALPLALTITADIDGRISEAFAAVARIATAVGA